MKGPGKWPVSYALLSRLRCHIVPALLLCELASFPSLSFCPLIASSCWWIPWHSPPSIMSERASGVVGYITTWLGCYLLYNSNSQEGFSASLAQFNSVISPPMQSALSSAMPSPSTNMAARHSLIPARWPGRQRVDYHRRGWDGRWIFFFKTKC